MGRTTTLPAIGISAASFRCASYQFLALPRRLTGGAAAAEHGPGRRPAENRSGRRPAENAAYGRFAVVWPFVAAGTGASGGGFTPVNALSGRRDTSFNKLFSTALA